MSIRENNSDIASKFLEIHNETERESVLAEAREISNYTDPYFYPPQGHNPSTKLKQPMNSSTPLALNNFISKLSSNLLPFGQNFFRIALDTYSFIELQQQLTEQGFDQDLAITEFSNELRRLERYQIGELEAFGYRKTSNLVFKHLGFAGNCMVKYNNESDMVVYGLDRFAIERDDSGFVLRSVLKERHSVANLTDEAFKVYEEKVNQDPNISDDMKKLYDQGFVNIYTSIIWNNSINKYEVWDELETGDKVSSVKKYDEEGLPWVFPVVNLVHGANYGRPILSMVLGHIKSAEMFRYDVNAIGRLNAHLLYSLDPSSTMRPRDVQKAKSGSVLPLKDGQLNIVQKQAYGELEQASQQLQILNREIGGALLSLQSSLRDGERVTAEEVRARIEETMKSIGVIVTEIETTYIKPLAEKSYFYLKKSGKVPSTISNRLKANIITGQSAFTRDDDLTKFRSMLADVANLDLFEGNINKDEVLRRFVELYNIENLSLVKTKQEKQQEQQAAQQAQQRAMLQQAIMSGNFQQQAPQQQAPQQ